MSRCCLSIGSIYSLSLITYFLAGLVYVFTGTRVLGLVSSVDDSKNGCLNFGPSETSSTEKLSEKDLDYKEACQNERGIGSTPLEEEWISSGQGFREKSGGEKKKDIKALEKTENSQAAISEGDIKIEKRLSKGILALIIHTRCCGYLKAMKMRSSLSYILLTS